VLRRWGILVLWKFGNRRSIKFYSCEYFRTISSEYFRNPELNPEKKYPIAENDYPQQQDLKSPPGDLGVDLRLGDLEVDFHLRDLKLNFTIAGMQSPPWGI